MGKIQNYRELKVWQKRMDLAADILQQTEKFPSTHRFGIAQQMQRSAISVCSNIAEGHARRATKEFIYFLRIAAGSLAELETQIMLAYRVKLFTETECQAYLDIADEIGKMLKSMTSKLQQHL